jgi:TM2 domain-containing membrane protein YozV
LKESADINAWIAGCLGWAFPGAGHIYQGKVVRGLILGSMVWGIFAIGLFLGGRLFDLFDMSNASAGILSQVFGTINLGTGLIYIIMGALDMGFTGTAELETFEYGNTFLLVAGLLNYRIMLDAFDIGAKRKP